MKNWIIVILIIIVGGIWTFKTQQFSKESAGSSSESSRVTTGTAELRNIKLNVSVAGEIGPAEQVSVRPEVNGKIDELPVDIGDSVLKGDLLFSLDARNLLIEIESRKTDISAAELQLEKAKRDYDRDQRLFEQELVAREIFENSGTAYKLAENSIERTKKEMALSQDRLEKTHIRAPFDCTILTRPVSVGQAVSGSGGFNSGTEVLTIANLNEMIINAHVNQADVIRLKKNMAVNIQVEAVMGLSVKGLVERIAPQATIVNGIKGFSARILLNEMDSRIQPGMTANISIPVASAENVLTAPLASVFTEYNADIQKQERFVYIQSNHQFEKRAVTIGISDYFNVEIISGLEIGDTLSLEKPAKELIIEIPMGSSLAGSSTNLIDRDGS